MSKRLLLLTAVVAAMDVTHTSAANVPPGKDAAPRLPDLVKQQRSIQVTRQRGRRRGQRRGR